MTAPLVFPAVTARHELPLLAAGQAQKEFFVNEALARIDALLHPSVAGEADVPPVDPQTGQSWLVGSAATGEWAGRSEAIASWDGTQWTYCLPTEGQLVYDNAAGQRLCYTGGWQRPLPPADPTGGAVVDAEARAAIASLLDILATLAFIPAN